MSCPSCVKTRGELIRFKQDFEALQRDSLAKTDELITLGTRLLPFLEMVIEHTDEQQQQTREYIELTDVVAKLKVACGGA